MPRVILHQYANSPFSQKVRTVLAYKGLAYEFVEQPAWMPKPHLTPLTGGYRRIPVLQLGADIYCDSALIVRRLEELAPEPSIFPNGWRVAAEATAAWADRLLFFKTVPLVFTSMADVIPQELFQDRKKMAPKLSMEALQAAVPSARSALFTHLGMLEHTLTRHDFLLGQEFSVADAAVHHCLWFARNDPTTSARIAALPGTSAWLARIDRMGAGNATPLAPEDALALARDSEPAPGRAVENGVCGLRPGTNIEWWSDDLLTNRFTGTVHSTDEHSIAVLHENDEVGRVCVHFPRSGCGFRLL
jgi:glutathione S-transferase